MEKEVNGVGALRVGDERRGGWFEANRSLGLSFDKRDIVGQSGWWCSSFFEWLRDWSIPTWVNGKQTGDNPYQKSSDQKFQDDAEV